VKPSLLTSAAQTGRLVALLRGEGLSEGTIQELLLPESVAKLQEILDSSAFPAHHGRPEGRPAPFHPERRKVLQFKAKQNLGSMTRQSGSRHARDR
jgi:hypothetical protein